MSEQCKGLTKAGKQCRVSQGLIEGYCRLHRDQNVAVQEETETKKNIESSHKEPVPVFPEAEDNVEEIVSEKNKGISAILIILSAIASFFMLLFFKGKKKRHK